MSETYPVANATAREAHKCKSPAYDVAVAYRIYPKVANAARGLPFSDDKLKLADTCLRSFRESLGKLHVKVWVLLDGCPPEYRELFAKYFDPKDIELLEFSGAGNCVTFAKQIDILTSQGVADLVYFAEDDYLYLPEKFPEMIAYLQAHPDVDFVSPYDHPDCYTLELHREPKWLRVSGGRYWRTAASSCLTFLTRRETLQKTQHVFRRYKRNSLDCSLWLSLTKRRVFDPAFFCRGLFREPASSKIVLKSWLYCWWQVLFGRTWTLWVPVPAIGTHLVRASLSPNIDWDACMQRAFNKQGADRRSCAVSPRKKT